MSKGVVAIIGAGPYGLSLAAHLKGRNIEHRIFGRPMQFWSQIAEAANGRFLKSYCFGTNISSPTQGFSFADYNRPRGLETFEPCSMANFAEYGIWFQQNTVPWVEQVNAAHVRRANNGFAITLANGEQFLASQVVVATGLSCFARVPSALATLPTCMVSHTANIRTFNSFAGRRVAVIGAGQSALEAAALLYEAGASPELLVREDEILWHSRVSQDRSLWRRLRSPISGLGTGPKGWAHTFSRCDAPLSGEISDPLRQDSSAARRCMVAARALREASASSPQGSRRRSARVSRACDAPGAPCRKRRCSPVRG